MLSRAGGLQKLPDVFYFFIYLRITYIILWLGYVVQTYFTCRKNNVQTVKVVKLFVLDFSSSSPNPRFKKLKILFLYRQEECTRDKNLLLIRRCGHKLTDNNLRMIWTYLGCLIYFLPSNIFFAVARWNNVWFARLYLKLFNISLLKPYVSRMLHLVKFQYNSRFSVTIFNSFCTHEN